jgi:hypothetical protein
VIRNRTIGGIGVVLALAMVGCGAASNEGKGSGTAPQAKQTPAGPGRLSDGTTTARVKKNQTTQLELLEMFGAPTVSTADATGLETWLYERNANESDTAGSSGAARLLSFFGGRRSDRSPSSVRTVTVIVRFNSNSTVGDYVIR